MNTHKTWVEIDTAALRLNLRLLRRAIGPNRHIVLVVKSDAYGHGAGIVAAIAAEEGVSHFAVAQVSEGAALRRAGIDTEIIVLHPPLDFEIDAIIDARLSPAVSGFETAAMLNERAPSEGLGVHVEINTGMNRLGIDWSSAPDTIARIATLPRISIQGTFTHFRVTDNHDTDGIGEQLERFKCVIAAARGQNIPIGFCHAASSSALARLSWSHLEGVRPGIMVYTGVNGECAEAASDDGNGPPVLPPLDQMTNVMSVYARVLHVRHVSEGEWIHYGEAYRAPHDMDVAVIPIGYGGGYPRHLSNNAEMLIHGHRAPIVGTVGMDMTIVSIEGLPTVAEGDIVTVLGRDGALQITAEELAQRAATIPYEIVCRLGNGLPRYVRGADADDTPVGIRERAVAPHS